MNKKDLLDSFVRSCINRVSEEHGIEIIEKFDLDGKFESDVQGVKPFLFAEYKDRCEKALEEAGI